MAEPLAKQRKRDAVGSLQGLASEIGFAHGFNRSSDLTRNDFMKFQKDVLAHWGQQPHLDTQA